MRIILSSLLIAVQGIAMSDVALASEAAVAGQPSNLSFDCVINYDQAAAEKDISSMLSSLKVDIQTNLATFKGEANGGSYTVTPKSLVITGDMKVHAPVVDTNKAQPCGDAIDLALTIPSVVITGTWSVSYLGLGHTGTFTDKITDLTIKGLANLATLDMATAKPGYNYDRFVAKVVSNGYNVGSNQFVVDGGSGVIGNLLTSVSNVMQATIMDQIYKSAAGSISADPKIVSLPAPVTVKVLTKP